MKALVEWVYGHSYLVMAVVFVVSLGLPRRRGKFLVCAGFFLLALHPALWKAAEEHFVVDLDFAIALLPWFFLLEVGCFIVGILQFSQNSGGFGGAAADSADVARVARYYTTDELISRTAVQPSANEDLDTLKNQWFAALGRFTAGSHEADTALTGKEKYERTLILERCIGMPPFENANCGQLRTVEVRFHGPGSAQPWLSVEVVYAVDQVVAGQVVLENDEVLHHRDRPGSLREFDRIENFLRTGLFRLRFDEGGLARMFAGLATAAATVPIAIPILAAAAVYAPIRAFLGGRQARSVFVPARRPDQLPPTWIGVPAGYWNALLPDLADKHEEVTSQLRAALEQRAAADVRFHDKEVVQWGGFHLKEVRRQSVIELRRAKVYLSVFPYGKDLYVRWASHISKQTWLLQKFPYQVGVGYRFAKNFLSWSVPLFAEVPSLFEYAAYTTATTDYDWADVDAAQDLAHELLTGLVRQIKERYQIAKEIDFAMKTGDRTERGPSKADGEGEKQKPGLWGRGLFSRQQ